MGSVLSIFIKCIAFALAILPLRIFLSAGKAMGFLLRIFGFRRDTVEANLKLAYPEWNSEARANFVKKNYSHYGILFLEFFRFFYRFDRFLLNHCEVEGAHYLKDALAKGNGVLVLTSHVGNWEVFGGHGAYILKVPVTMVTKQIKPAWFHRLIETTRAELGVKMAFEPKTLRTVLRSLKNGELAGFVMDQYTGAPVGARVPFFGVAVGSHVALATLALRTKAPVIPGFAYRLPNGDYRVRFEPEIALIENETDLDQAILANTASYVRCIERWVREFPEQWLWIHKRWKGDLSPLAPNTIGEMLK